MYILSHYVPPGPQGGDFIVMSPLVRGVLPGQAGGDFIVTGGELGGDFRATGWGL